MYNILMMTLLFLIGRDDDEEQVDDEHEADTSMDLAVSHDWTPVGLGLEISHFQPFFFQCAHFSHSHINVFHM